MKGSITVFFFWYFIASISNIAHGQTLSLDHATAYADTNICYLNKKVFFTGQVNAYNYITKPYLITADFGNGTTDTLHKATNLNFDFKDTFRVTGMFSSAGLTTVKIRLFDDRNVLMDSIVREYDVNNCEGGSGKVFYDALQNCIHDGDELRLINHFIWFSVNGQGIRAFLDLDGFFNVPVFPGDTITLPDQEIEWMTAYISNAACSWTPITGQVYNKHVPVRLNQPHFFGTSSDDYGPYYICTKTGDYYFSFGISSPRGGTRYTKLALGNAGAPLDPIPYSKTDRSYQYARYDTAGFYNTTILLYGGIHGTYGPIMASRRKVYAADCKDVVVSLFYDANANCIKDSNERALPAHDVWLYSGIRNRYPVSADTGGYLNVSVYPGDTVIIDSIVEVHAVPGYYTPHKISSVEVCGKRKITWDDSFLVAPYRPYGKIQWGGSSANEACMYDTLTFSVFSGTLGIPYNTRGKLTGYWGDGTADSVDVVFRSDTLTAQIRHMYISSGNMAVMFVLQLGTIQDTFRMDYRVGDCYYNYVRAYRDLNRNCVKDPGEPYINDYAARMTSRDCSTDISTGIARCTIYGAADSVGNINARNYGLYNRNTTGSFCNWPVFNTPNQFSELPLIDSVSFTGSIQFTGINPCQNRNMPLVSVWVSGNTSGDIYRMEYYPGDGNVISHSMDDLSRWSYAWWIQPGHTYLPGIYYPGMRVFNETKNIAVYEYQTSDPVGVTDTCGGRLTVNLYHDVNNNCVRDGVDVGLVNAYVHGFKNGVPVAGYTDAGGKIRFPADEYDVFDLRYPTHTGNLNLSCGRPEEQLISYPFDTPVVDVPYTCAGLPDLSVSMTHIHWIPGLIDTIYLYISGHRCVPDPGKVVLKLDPRMKILYHSWGQPQSSGGAMSWNVSSMQTLPDVIKVAIDVNDMLRGEELCVYAEITAAFPERNTANNHFSLCDDVVLHFPELHKSVVTNNTSRDSVYPGDELFYTIRFRNATQQKISRIFITDTLNDYFEQNTLVLQRISASHQFALIDDHIMRISFNDLELDPGQEIQVSFSVKTKAGLASGTLISNRATVIHGLHTVSSSEPARVWVRQSSPAGVDFQRKHKANLEIFPNPATDVFNVYWYHGYPGTTADMSIIDGKGRVMQRTMLKSGYNVVRNNLTPGIYILRFVFDDEVMFKKIVVRR